jgi:hypothetical protein
MNILETPLHKSIAPDNAQAKQHTRPEAIAHVSAGFEV